MEALFQTRVMDVWRFATTTSGAQCAIAYGVLQMLMWSVDSWGSAIIQVSVVGYQYNRNIIPLPRLQQFFYVRRGYFYSAMNKDFFYQTVN